MQQTNMTDDEWTVDEAIENLKNAMNESGQSTSDLFSSIDANDDGEINGPELYKGLLSILVPLSWTSFDHQSIGSM